MDETVEERQMKYQKIVHALDRILYLIGKQGISYQGTQKTAAANTLWIPEYFLAIVRQVKHRYLSLYDHIHSALRKTSSVWVQQVKINWLALSQNTPFKYDLMYM